MSNRTLYALGGVVLLLLLAGGGWLLLSGRDGAGEMKTDVGDSIAAPVATVLATPRSADPGNSGSAADPAPTPTPRIVATADAAAGGLGIDLSAPPTVAELLARYPQLEELLGNVDLTDEAQLQAASDLLLQLYNSEGLEGLDTFMRESGLLAALNLDSAYFDFVLAYEDGGAAAAEALARERGLVTDDDLLRLVLVLDTEDASVLTPQLALIDGQILDQYGNEVEIGIPLARLEALGASDEALSLFIQLSHADHVVGVRVPETTHPSALPAGDQGPALTGAAAWHAAGFSGQGVRVGIIDPDGFYGFLDLAGSELPPLAQIVIAPNYTAEELNTLTGPHGTACAEIVHEMAPDAQLFLAYSGGSRLGMGQAVEWMLDNGVQVISYSAGSMIGSMDGTGPLAELVDWATARDVLWINASGNYAEAHLSVAFADGDDDTWHEFPSGDEILPFTVDDPGAAFGLTWDDNWGGATEDYDLYVLAEAADGYDVVASARNAQTGRAADEPYELLDVALEEGATYYLAIKAYDVTRPAQLNLLGYGVTFAYAMPEGSLAAPADADHALSVGATFWGDDRLEEYSSQGPTRDGRGKPDISAPAGVASASYGEFYGTSASAPHVAGAAALVLSATPGTTAADARSYLLGQAVDLGPAGYDTGYGYGRLALGEPPAAVDATPPPATPGTALATVWNVWQAHNVFVAGVKGMEIHVSFDASNMQGATGTVLATFFDLAAGQPLLDENGSYATTNGQVATWQTFQPRYAETRYDNLLLFMPYEELDVAAGDHNLAFEVAVVEDSSSQTLARSSQIPFSFNRSSPAYAWATLHTVGVDHNVREGDETGMRISVTFDVANHDGQTGEVAAYFFFGDEQNRPLLDFNDRYRTPSGTVGVGRQFTPRSADASYEDFTLFLPYSELHMAAGQYQLKFYLIVWDATGRDLAISDWVYFYYEQS